MIYTRNIFIDYFTRTLSIYVEKKRFAKADEVEVSIFSRIKYIYSTWSQKTSTLERKTQKVGNSCSNP